MAATNQSDGSINHRALLVNARRVVVKVGTGVVCNAENEFDPQQVAALASSIAGLVSAGRQVVLVSSGAVTLGAAELGVHRSRLKDASVTRACAAVGQCKLHAGLRGIIFALMASKSPRCWSRKMTSAT